MGAKRACFGHAQELHSPEGLANVLAGLVQHVARLLVVIAGRRPGQCVTCLTHLLHNDIRGGDLSWQGELLLPRPAPSRVLTT